MTEMMTSSRVKTGDLVPDHEAGGTRQKLEDYIDTLQQAADGIRNTHPEETLETIDKALNVISVYLKIPDDSLAKDIYSIGSRITEMLRNKYFREAEGVQDALGRVLSLAMEAATEKNSRYLVSGAFLEENKAGILKGKYRTEVPVELIGTTIFDLPPLGLKYVEGWSWDAGRRNKETGEILELTGTTWSSDKMGYLPCAAVVVKTDEDEQHIVPIETGLRFTLRDAPTSGAVTLGA